MAQFRMNSLAALCLLCAIASTPAIAQISSDGTLSTTVTTPDNLNFTIDNGNRAGNNLFHSFSQFSIPTNGSASFNNTADINNIFNRVTGGTISNIDGLIQANSNANVFLLNPNGIIFGPNARLDVGGSFIGTTANSILFADGVTFSATPANTSPLLTVSAPVGLQLGSNPGEIEVQGTGHQLSGGFPRPVSGMRGASELRVKPGNTLALIGGEIALQGGVLSGEGGQLALGAVGAQNPNAVVQMVPTASGWTFDYGQIQSFAPIQLSQRALVDGSGAIAGNINLTGSNITLMDGSWVLLGNEGTQASGRIAIDASESLTLRQTSDRNFTDNRIMTFAANSGEGGDIQISTPTLDLLDFSVIFATTYSAGKGGNVAILATDSVLARSFEEGEAPLGVRSNISTSTLGAGDAGQLSVATRRLRLLPGGRLTSNTFGIDSGRGGKIVVNATESVEIIGATPTATGEASIVLQSFGTGRGGDLELNTARLSILNGGFISASNLSRGEGGTIAINASTSIEVRGSQFSQTFGTVLSQIKAATDIPTPPIQRFFRLSPIPSGDAGRITLNTPQLTVTDGAEIVALNQGIGQGGRIAANADLIFLDTGGKLLVDTFSGEGGEIELNARNALILRRGSQITATADNAGNGGNITITTPAIVAFENSDIIANAFQGNGGNITISANGIFGTEFRPQLTPESDITASSQFGVDGIVEINNLDTDPASESAQLPEEVSDPSQQIVSGCAVAQENRLIVTGRGGLPPNPNEGLRRARTWSDVRDLSEFRSSGQMTAQSKSANAATPNEATGWVVNEAGQVELIATVPNGGAIAQSVNCGGKVGQS